MLTRVNCPLKDCISNKEERCNNIDAVFVIREGTTHGLTCLSFESKEKKEKQEDSKK